MKIEYENRKEEQFWISPDGKCHFFDGNDDDIASIHSEIASLLFPDIDYPDDYMMKEGWILVGSCVYNYPVSDEYPTEKQLKTLGEKSLDNLHVLVGNTYKKYQI